MADAKKLVIILSRGLDDERSSVALSIANSGISTGFEVLLFLVAAGVDWARKGAADLAHPNPADPSMKEMLQNFTAGGGKIQICPPCARVRGYTEDSFIPGVVLAGAPAMLEWVKDGAETISL